MAINRTNLEHAGIAAVVQGLLTLGVWALWGLDLGMILLAALPGVFLYFGREHAQRENGLEKAKGETSITWETTLEALRVWEWPEDARMDFCLPVVVSGVQAAGWWVGMG